MVLAFVYNVVICSKAFLGLVAGDSWEISTNWAKTTHLWRFKAFNFKFQIDFGETAMIFGSCLDLDKCGFGYSFSTFGDDYSCYSGIEETKGYRIP